MKTLPSSICCNTCQTGRRYAAMRLGAWKRKRYTMGIRAAHLGHADGTEVPVSRTPFGSQPSTMSKEEQIKLKCERNYWQKQFDQSARLRVRDAKRHKAEMALRDARDGAKIAALEAALEKVTAQFKNLQKAVFDKKGEKSTATSEKQAGAGGANVVKKKRGQQCGSHGHGRTPTPAGLPVVETIVDLPEDKKGCAHCGLPFALQRDTEDSDVIEVEVKAYIRRLRRNKYLPTCACPGQPRIVTAPVPAKIIPKGKYGVTVWTDLLLDKFLYARPTHRLLNSWKSIGLDVAQGTITDGLARLTPLFEPVMAEFWEKQLTEGYWLADETGWKVFVMLEGKKTNRWYLWAFRSLSVAYFRLDPTRAATVPLGHFKLLREGIVLCDRYSAYKKMARLLGLLLAFCWAHVRRDFLTLATGFPHLEQWALGWVASIGTLYHINNQRMKTIHSGGDTACSTVLLEQHLAGMVEERRLALADTHLHEDARKVMESMERHWSGLIIFVAHPEIAMDNNGAEQILRNAVCGRKNFYGSGSIWSGQLAASMYTILQTLDNIWGINPRQWMNEYLQACADAGRKAPEDLSPFIPWQMSPERLASFGGRQPTCAGVAKPAPFDTS